MLSGDFMGVYTPFQYLNELALRQMLKLRVELTEEKVEGPVHEPIFKYRLTVEYDNQKLEEIGCGKSKKDAKHNTALAILKAMNISTKELFGESYGEPAAVELEDRSGVDSDPTTNPVGQLQELCMKMKLPPPTYALHSEDGLPHERVFVLACRVGDSYMELGRGKSKKLAKRNAAHMMALRLKNIPSETSNVHGYDDDDDKIVEGLKTLNLSRDNQSRRISVQNATVGDVERVSKLHEIYRCLLTEKMPELKDPNFVVSNPIGFLAGVPGIAKPMYIEFDELSWDGIHQCLVQIPFDPPMVAIGTGGTKEHAQEAAAIDAINIFRGFIHA